MTKEEVRILFNFHLSEKLGNGGQFLSGSHCDSIIKTIESLTSDNAKLKAENEELYEKLRLVTQEHGKRTIENEELKKKAREFALTASEADCNCYLAVTVMDGHYEGCKIGDAKNFLKENTK